MKTQITKVVASLMIVIVAGLIPSIARAGGIWKVATENCHSATSEPPKDVTCIDIDGFAGLGGGCTATTYGLVDTTGLGSCNTQRCEFMIDGGAIYCGADYTYQNCTWPITTWQCPAEDDDEDPNDGCIPVTVTTSGFSYQGCVYVTAF